MSDDQVSKQHTAASHESKTETYAKSIITFHQLILPKCCQCTVTIKNFTFEKQGSCMNS